AHVRGRDIIQNSPAHINPQGIQLVFDLINVLAARDDAGAVDAPGDVLAGVLEQFLLREVPLVLLEGQVVPPALGDGVTDHRDLVTPGGGFWAELSVSYFPARRGSSAGTGSRAAAFPTAREPRRHQPPCTGMHTCWSRRSHRS